MRTTDGDRRIVRLSSVYVWEARDTGRAECMFTEETEMVLDERKS